MPGPSLVVVECPDCRSRLETNLAAGELIQCPSCDEVFRVGPGNIKSPALKDRLARVAIPVGYVLFVAVPSCGVLYWALAREPAKPGEQAAGPPLAAGVAALPPKEARPTPADWRAEREQAERKRAEREQAEKEAAEAEAAAQAALAGIRPPEPAAKSPPPKVPAPAPVEKPDPLPPGPVGIPAPREVVTEGVQVAPEPREVLWKFPTGGWQSKWQTLGAIDLRLSHVAVAKYPVRTARGTVEESRTPALVVVVEARLNNPKRSRTHLGWTSGLAHYASLFTAGADKSIPWRAMPPGGKLNHGLEFPVPLGPDGVVRDVLLFDLPPAGTGELELRLECERVKEGGDLWFKIPTEGWVPKEPGR